MMANWRDPKILELANQLTYSNADKRLEQLCAAVALLPDLDPAKNYPWDLIHFRITGFQSRTHAEHNIPGKLLLADLSTLIEFLSDTLAIKVENAGGPVLAMEEVGRKFNVSTKTIQRWRKQGLAALRYAYPDGRRRLGFLESAITQFAQSNQARVQRSAAFKQLSDEERSAIIAMARRLAMHCQYGIKEISQLIAAKVARSPETIRYTIRKFDREHPEAAIFSDAAPLTAPATASPADAPNPLQPTDRAAIIHSFDHGTPVKSIAERYCRTPTTIFRVVTDQRAHRLKTLKIDFVPNPLFDHPDADHIILKVLPAEALAHAHATVAAGTNPQAADVYMARTPRDLPPYLAEIFRQPVMPQELELDAFRRLNYLKFQASRLQAQLDLSAPTAPAAHALAALESLLLQANDIKNQLVQANLRVAVHVARKHQRIDRPLPELFSDATIWLMRAVECFDFSRPTKFSTYAGYAIMKNFARDRAEQLTRRDKNMITGQEELLGILRDRDQTSVPERIDAANLQSDLLRVIQQLPTRERELLTRHYGLDPAQSPLSLSELGAEMGITKARVRQLETRALRKLKHLLESRRQKLAAHAT